jgi:hypothetical protein
MGGDPPWATALGEQLSMAAATKAKAARERFMFVCPPVLPLYANERAGIPECGGIRW